MNEENNRDKDFLQKEVLRTESDIHELRSAKDYGGIDLHESEEFYTKDVTAQVQLKDTVIQDGYLTINFSDIFSFSGETPASLLVSDIHIPESYGKITSIGADFLTVQTEKNVQPESLEVSFNISGSFNGDDIEFHQVLVKEESISDIKGLDHNQFISGNIQIDKNTEFDSSFFDDNSEEYLDENAVTITERHLLNETDIEDENVSLVSIDIAEGEGTVLDNEDGSFTITPMPDYTGDLNIVYTVENGEQLIENQISFESLKPLEEDNLQEIEPVDLDENLLLDADEISSYDEAELIKSDENADFEVTESDTVSIEDDISPIFTDNNELNDNNKGHGNDPDGVDGDNPSILSADNAQNDNNKGHGNDPDGVDEDNPSILSADNAQNDNNKGHGNDPDGVDEDNPSIVRADAQNDNNKGHGNDPDGVDEDNPSILSADNAQNDNNKGHGNDPDGVDEDNPSILKVDNAQNDNNKGHGNDPDGIDEDNPAFIRKTTDSESSRGSGKKSDLENLRFSEEFEGTVDQDWISDLEQDDAINSFENNDWTQNLENEEIDFEHNADNDDIDMEQSEVDVPIENDENDDKGLI